MPTYEYICPKCSKEFDILVTMKVKAESQFTCDVCEVDLTQEIRTAPPINIPYHMQASPSTKKAKARVPINIIDHKPGGGYTVTRIGQKKDIEND